MTQEGIALASKINLPHVAQYVRPLVDDGLVRERIAHVKGGRRRRKVYDLTASGQLQVARLRERVRDELVRVRDVAGVREATVAQVLREAEGRTPLLEVLYQAAEVGVVDLSPVATTPSAFIELLADAPKLGTFVGRGAQLQAVTGDDDRARVFVVRGIAGIGKSTFAAKACELLRGRKNLFWRRVRAWDTPQSLFASLSDFLSLLGKPGLRSVLVRGEVARASEVLRNDLPGTRSFLVFDDAHEAIRETVPFLRLLKEAIAGAADVRALILTRDALSFYDRRDVALEGLVSELDLAGLKPEDTAAMLSGDPGGAAILKITRALGGHPLLLELARSHHGTNSHRLRQVGRFVEEEVYRKLSDSERRVMKTASLYRVPVPRDALIPDRGLSDGVLLSLKDRSLIRPVGEEAFEVHETIRSAFLSFLTESEREGLGTFAVTCLRNLASKAREARKLVAAIDYLSNALELSASKEDRAAIFEDLGDVTERAGDLSAALTAYNEAMRLSGNRGALARLHRKAATALTVRGQWLSASKEADAALGILGETFDVERGLVDLVRSRIAAGLDEWEEARDHGELAERIFEAAGHPSGYAQSLLELAYVRMHSPRPDLSQAEEDLLRAVSMQGHQDDVEFTAKLHSALTHFYMYHVPSVDRANEHLRASEQLVGAGADPQARLEFLITKGLYVEDFLEDHTATEAILLEALALARKIYSADGVAAARYGLGLTRFYTGRFDLAMRELGRLTVDMRDVGLGMSRWGSNLLHWLLMTELCCLLEADVSELKRTASRVHDQRLTRSLETRKEEACILEGIDRLLEADWDGSLASFEQAVHEAEAGQIPVTMFLSLFLYGAALRAVGRKEEAGQYSHRARNLLLKARLKAWSSILPEMDRRIEEAFQLLPKSSENNLVS